MHAVLVLTKKNTINPLVTVNKISVTSHLFVMSLLPITIHPNEILRKRSKEIDREFVLSEENQQLIKDMTETLYEKDGVGLAAPQIGKNIRLIIISKLAFKDSKIKTKNNIDKHSDLILINPVWQKLNKKTTTDTEGCLSVPNTFGKVKRYKDIEVEAFNEKGEILKFQTKKFLARVIQHEVDHLEGILFIDKATDLFSQE